MKKIEIEMVEDYVTDEVKLKKGEFTDSDKINPLLVGYLVYNGYANWI